ncbi:MAG: hypothetical protein EZS28_003948 [Streblomastix strix]|uniref:Uncharacterized protein n=1 Tax=Streblomastix strix TaxID=222440 RepID=A0A5J4X186_9EUKA|nr:MAG: hypothetical protein EZS28_003948 [Streblomastix strix]
MTRTKKSIAEVSRLLQLYDPNTNMNVNDKQKRSNLSSILSKIGFYGQRNNVIAVEQAINAVVSQINRETVTFPQIIQQCELYIWCELIDIKELREEFDPELLDEEGIFDPERYRQQQHQLRAQEIEKHRRKQDEDRQARQAQLLDEFHNVEDMNIDILFETDQQEISDYIRIHEKYVYHRLNTDNDVIMLCDIQKEAQFNRIKNIALNRYNKETADLDKHLDSVYDKEKGNVFKLNVDFGVLIERVDGNNEDQTIQYKYVLPVNVNSERRAPLEIRSRDNINMYKWYLRTVIGSVQERKINEKFGDISQVTATLIPYAIASTVKLASGIHSFYYDIRTDDFLDKWLEQVFEEAKYVKKDNKYTDETIPQYYEVPVIGFNSAKFDASELFKNLKSKDWTISKYLCSSTIAKQIIVKHQSSSIQLRFVDFKIYIMQHKLKDAVRDFGNGLNKKGRFPHEFINTNNYMNELNKSEPFPIEAFDNKLRNKKLSEVRYKEYLVEAAKHKSRWDYLKHYNILDTRVLIEPIDYLIELMFKYKVDMLANISMSQCANSIKYSITYNGFDIDGDYNCESTDKLIEITQNYWRAKVDSYIEQGNKKGRDSSNKVMIDDYDYFKEIFKNQRCHMCNARFTWKNKPKLDRIDDNKGHSKGNVIKCCLYCNVCKANRDDKQMKLMVQLKKYALLKRLPMALTSNEGYQLLSKGIIGSISNVMHRYNISGETRINHFEFDQENKCVYSIDSDYVMTHAVQLDFHSQYPSVMSGEPNMLNSYTNHIIFIPAQLIEKITDQDRCKALIYDTSRFSNDPLVVDKMLLFVAEVRGHTDERYINEVINWGPILRNIDITTNKETIGEFMYNHLVNHQLLHDKTE